MERKCGIYTKQTIIQLSKESLIAYYNMGVTEDVLQKINYTWK